MRNELIIMFFIGFISFWYLIAFVSIFSNVDISPSSFEYFLELPILVVVMPITVIFSIIVIQWRCVLRPISVDKWQELVDTFTDIKYIKITKHFYIVWDKKASNIIKKLIFVRIKESRGID